jgi:hypothetical protein
MTKSKGIIIKDPRERFLKNIIVSNDSDGCWMWLGRKNYKGYGRMKINNRHVQAHRFSYEIYIGEIQDGLCVCHKCDNPACVNPNHLFLGTIQENNLDRDKKGRKALGENNGKSKLTLNDVIEIKRLLDSGFSVAEVSRRFNSKHSTINAVKIGRSWTWVK